MAKQVIWSPLARRKRSEILEIWIKNNKSDFTTFNNRKTYFMRR